MITPVADTAETGAIAVYRGVKLKIARANNTKFKAAFRRITKPYKEQMDKEILDEKTSEDLYLQCLAETILVDWKDFVLGGEDIPYTVENAIDLLRNDSDCLQFVTNYSQSIDNYLMQDEEELKGKQ